MQLQHNLLDFLLEDGWYQAYISQQQGYSPGPLSASFAGDYEGSQELSFQLLPSIG
jgi:hypothetical protein